MHVDVVLPITLQCQGDVSVHQQLTQLHLTTC